MKSKLGSTSTYLDRFVEMRLAKITGEVGDAASPNFSTATMPSVQNLTMRVRLEDRKWKLSSIDFGRGHEALVPTRARRGLASEVDGWLSGVSKRRPSQERQMIRDRFQLSH